MDKGYLNFISFARGIQNGFNPDKCPLLEEEAAEKEYERALTSLCSAYDIEQDILKQYTDGELDSWDAVEQLEDELGYSYDEACRKVSSIHSSGAVFSSGFIIPDIEEAPAYWISPDCRIIAVYKKHIDMIWDCPEAFGYSQEDLVHIYDAYDEPYRSEGDARNYIVDDMVLRRGWIRIRFQPVSNLYHIEVGDLIGKRRDALWLWASALVSVNSRKALPRVLICKCGQSEPIYTGSLQELVDFKLFSSRGMGFHLLVPINNVYDFLSINPIYMAYKRKRKRSKYHGALVNNTFDDAPTGLSTGASGSPASVSSNLKAHPSIRFLVVNHILHPTRRHLIESSLSGSLDTLLYQTYLSAVGRASPVPINTPGNNLKHTGKNGRVVLSFKSDSGHSTEVDLGGSLETGYVVQQIDDGLGLFPEGTEIGDLIDNAVIQEIIRGQGEREKMGRESLISRKLLDSPPPLYADLIQSGFEFKRIFSMAVIRNPDKISQYILNLFPPLAVDKWFGDDVDPEKCNKITGQVGAGSQVFYFNFKRVSDYKSRRESPSGDAIQFSSLYLQQDGVWYKKEDLSQSDFSRCFNVVTGNDGSNVIQTLGMQRTHNYFPLT